MSDTTTDVAIDTEATDVPDTTVDTAPAADLGDAGKKALDAERRARRQAEKERAELAAKVAEFENASKSEAEKAAARAEAAEKALAEMTAKALRLQVATEAGIPADLHEFLTGTDEESLRAQATKLAEIAATASAPRQPKPDPTQGARPDGSGPKMLTPDEVSELFRQGNTAAIDAARREGRISL